VTSIKPNLFRKHYFLRSCEPILYWGPAKRRHRSLFSEDTFGQVVELIPTTRPVEHLIPGRPNGRILIDPALALSRALERGHDGPDKKVRRFCKRLLTAVQPLRLQKRPVLEQNLSSNEIKEHPAMALAAAPRTDAHASHSSGTLLWVGQTFLSARIHDRADRNVYSTFVLYSNRTVRNGCGRL